jgi:hypothetical protein
MGQTWWFEGSGNSAWLIQICYYQNWEIENI